MAELIKALPCGALLAWLVALFMGNGGARGGMLSIETMQLAGESFYWSWPLFLVGTGLAWGIMALQN